MPHQSLTQGYGYSNIKSKDSNPVVHFLNIKKFQSFNCVFFKIIILCYFAKSVEVEWDFKVGEFPKEIVYFYPFKLNTKK